MECEEGDDDIMAEWEEILRKDFLDGARNWLKCYGNNWLKHKVNNLFGNSYLE